MELGKHGESVSKHEIFGHGTPCPYNILYACRSDMLCIDMIFYYSIKNEVLRQPPHSAPTYYLFDCNLVSIGCGKRGVKNRNQKNRWFSSII